MSAVAALLLLIPAADLPELRTERVVALRCSVRELRENPDGYHWPNTRIEDFVDEAEVIVRAVATGAAANHDESQYPVRFRVIEALRGSVPDGELVLRGRIVEHDDFNPRDVPYQMVRPSGQHGDCYARDYRVGAEYLFVLIERRGELTPHWAPLAPTNEQIRGVSDPWLLWVQERVER